MAGHTKAAVLCDEGAGRLLPRSKSEFGRRTGADFEMTGDVKMQLTAL